MCWCGAGEVTRCCANGYMEKGVYNGVKMDKFN